MSRPSEVRSRGPPRWLVLLGVASLGALPAGIGLAAPGRRPVVSAVSRARSAGLSCSQRRWSGVALTVLLELRGGARVRRQIIGMARWGALVRAARRHLEHEQWVVAGTVTREQLLRIAWLLKVNGKLDEDRRLSDRELAEKLANAIGLPVLAAQRLLDEGRRFGRGEVRGLLEVHGDDEIDTAVRAFARARGMSESAAWAALIAEGLREIREGADDATFVAGLAGRFGVPENDLREVLRRLRDVGDEAAIAAWADGLGVPENDLRTQVVKEGIVAVREMGRTTNQDEWLDDALRAVREWFAKEPAYAGLARARQLSEDTQRVLDRVLAGVEEAAATGSLSESMRRRLDRAGRGRGVVGWWAELTSRLGVVGPLAGWDLLAPVRAAVTGLPASAREAVRQERRAFRLDRGLGFVAGPDRLVDPGSAAVDRLRAASAAAHTNAGAERAEAEALRAARLALRPAPGSAFGWVPAAAALVGAGVLVVSLAGPLGWAVAPLVLVIVAAIQLGVSRAVAAWGHATGSRRTARAARLAAGTGIVLFGAALAAQAMMPVPAWFAPVHQASVGAVVLRWAWFVRTVRSQERAWARQVRMWETTEVDARMAAEAAGVLMAAVLDLLRTDRRTGSVDELLARVDAPQRSPLEQLLNEWAAGPQPLLTLSSTDGTRTWGPNPMLRDLAARAPPAAKAALRDPVTVLGLADPTAKPGEFAEQTYTFLRAAAWRHDQAAGTAATIRQLPRFLDLVHDLWTSTALLRLSEAQASGSSWRVRLARLHLPRAMRSMTDPAETFLGEVQADRTVRDQLRDAQIAAGVTLYNRAAAAGFRPSPVAWMHGVIVEGFGKANLSWIMGYWRSVPVEASKLPYADAKVAQNFGLTQSQMNGIAPLATLFAPLMGFVLSKLGERTVSTNRWIVVASGVGLLAWWVRPWPPWSHMVPDPPRS
ncbi:hypothetical protein BJF90_09185 [Pseudonocardia sp. CNS-004]|nr:hypothetical protein BJF90_09185 [Pseudonocardia sp. CNS-004]